MKLTRYPKSIKSSAIFTAILAAALYGISSPISKLLLNEIPPTLMAALLYLGAGLGMLALKLMLRMKNKPQTEARVTKRELPYVAGMILLDIAAPILLLLGLNLTNPANVSLLNNFEIVTTALIAWLFFKEAVGGRMWLAIVVITLSSIVLSVEDFFSFTFSLGSLLILLACVCWGFENNCTRMLSIKDPTQIVIIKGIGSGLGALLISYLKKQFCTNMSYILFALGLGFIAYGLSIFFYIKAQRNLGAARTSAYYAMAPFIGVIISFLFFREAITLRFLVALILMLIGTFFIITEVHAHRHIHTAITHDHKHNHTDEHHNHGHIPEVVGEHSHVHTHTVVEHSHLHTPDMHHNHTHQEKHT